MFRRYCITVRRNIGKMPSGIPVWEYHFYMANGFYLGGIRLPHDGKDKKDIEIITDICEFFSIRWKVIKPRKKLSN